MTATELRAIAARLRDAAVTDGYNSPHSARLFADAAALERIANGYDGAIAEIAAERQRQISAEGWTPQHDDEHRDAELAMAAMCYAGHAAGCAPDENGYPWPWPWDATFWKPTTARRDLIKAAALIVAEIERLDRAAMEAAK